MSDEQTGIGAKSPVAAVGEIDEIGIGMLGYAFMGKAHSNAFRKIQYMTWPPPLMPRLVAIAGRDEEAVAGAAQRYGYERWTTDWRDIVSDPSIGLFDNGGPNSLHAEPTIAAAEAGKHVALREAARARRRRELRHLAAGRGDRRQAPLRVQLPLRPGCAPRPRDDRGRRARRDPPLPRPLPPGLGRRSDARHLALRCRRGRLGCARRPRRSRDRPRPLPRRRHLDRVGARPHLPPRPPGRRRDRGCGRVRGRRDRDDRGDAARARPPQRVPVGDQRLQGLARLRHGEAERAPGLPRRRRPRPRLQDRARLRGRPSRSGSSGGRPGTSSAGARRSCTSSTTCSRRSRTTPTSRPYGATFEDGYRAAEVCDAIVRSSASGKRETISYR